MDISSEQARQSLAEIEGAQDDLKRAFDRQSGRIMIAFGIAYFFGPLCMHFFGEIGVIPLELLLVGAIGFTIFETSRKSIVSSPSNSAFGAAWGIVYLFGVIFFVILSPFGWKDVESQFMVRGEQMWAYGVALAMFAYVLMGLWMGRIYLVIGVVVLGFTLVGLFVLRDWYWLWCGLTAGGTLMAWFGLASAQRQSIRL